MIYNSSSTNDANDRLYLHHATLVAWSWVKRKVRIWLAMRQLRMDIIHERRELSKLPDHLLRDIDIRREDAVIESARSADDLPLSRIRQMRSSL